MRQLTFIQPHVVEWREVTDPVLQGGGEALVRPVVVANCDLDRPIISGRFPVPGPFALGHEFIAEVVDVGDAVATVAPGDTVIVPFQVSAAVGVKVTEIVQVAPAFTVVPQVLVSPKDLLATLLVMLREVLLKFVRVMD